MYYTAKGLLVSQMDATLESQASAIITATEVEDDELEVDDDIVAFAGFAEGSHDALFIIRSARDAHVLTQVPSRASAMLRSLSAPADGSTRGFTTLADGTPCRIHRQVYTPAKDELRRFGTLEVIVGADASVLFRTLRTLAMVLLGTGLVGIVVVVCAVRAALHRGLRPLRNLAASLRQVAPGRAYTLPSPDSHPDELVPVVEKLHDLLQRVDASLARERRFSSHAAHELRTPLAELKSATELAATWPEEATPERHREMLDTIAELEVLLDRLALLARAESGREGARREPLVLPGAMETLLERVRPAAEAKNVKLAVTCPAMTLHTDGVLWQAIMQNLLGNAVSHTPAGSTVEVTVTSGGMCVTNPAPQLQAGDLPHLFERFWRKDNAQGGAEQSSSGILPESSHGLPACGSGLRDNDSAFPPGGARHSGLGLSIVEACCEALGGTCRASLDAQHRLVLEVFLPEQRG